VRGSAVDRDSGSILAGRAGHLDLGCVRGGLPVNDGETVPRGDADSRQLRSRRVVLEPVVERVALIARLVAAGAAQRSGRIVGSRVSGRGAGVDVGCLVAAAKVDGDRVVVPAVRVGLAGRWGAGDGRRGP